MEGIDIYSKFQTVTNWNSVRAADIGWCYQKVSDGTTTRAVQSPAAGKAAGVLQGGYHFSQPGDPVAQANFLVDRCTSLGMLDLNPALDLEDNPPGVGSNIPDSQKADWAIAFGRQVLARGHGFTLYANDSTWSLVKAKLMSALPQTFRWVARYRTTPPDNPYDAWQYTSSGSVPGIVASSVDRSKGKIPSNGGEMVLDGSDATVVWDGAVVDKNTNSTTKAREVLGWAHWEAHQANVKLGGLSTAISDLRALIIADDANDVTAEAVAQALRGVIVAEVVPAVKQAAQEALVDVDVEATLSDEKVAQIAGATADILHDRLAG